MGFIISNVRNFLDTGNKFFNLSLLNLFMMVLFGASLLPYQTSLQGTYLTVGVIAMFAAARTAGGLMQPILTNVSMYTLVKILFALDLVELATACTIPFDKEVSAYLFSIGMTLQGAFAIAFWIKMDAAFARIDIAAFESYRVKESVITSTAALIGAAATVVVQLLASDQYYIYHTLVIGIVFITLQLAFVQAVKQFAISEG